MVLFIHTQARVSEKRLVKIVRNNLNLQEPVWASNAAYHPNYPPWGARDQVGRYCAYGDMLNCRPQEARESGA